MKLNGSGVFSDFENTPLFCMLIFSCKKPFIYKSFCKISFQSITRS